jgi:hypothetical protein
LKRRSASNDGRQGKSRDLFADLHAYREELAARFNYDNLRLIEYIYSQPLPRGMRDCEIPAKKKRPASKSR